MARYVWPVYKGLDAVAEVRQISYQAADGLEIPAYLTLPRGRAQTNLPLVVLPHGGPAAADSNHFDWWAQALAAQGYAVIQPNYRGSSLSARFREAGYGEWRQLRWTNANSASADNHAQRYWDRFMGVSGPGDPALLAISPIEHIGAVTAPVLLIHGRDDTVVPYEQSEIMADALKHAGKFVEFVTLEHEDHWLSRSATRFQMLQATVKFLKANNPPD